MKTHATALGPRHFRRSVFGLMAGMMAVATFTGGVRADDYRLDVLDKLRIRVVEWQTAEGTVRDWSAVSGDYAVGASGQISLPLIGDLPVSGKTTAEVSADIGKRMQMLFGLRDLPTASVELAQYRPVYISGEVQTPGEYPFSPNMTVLKAVSLGGGLRRADPGQRIARDFIRADGDAAVLVAERNRLLVRRARLMAEIAEKQDIAVPPELKDAPDADGLVASEKALLVSRDKKQKLQLEALADLKNLLQKEVASLDKKTETQTRQLQLVNEDLEKAGGLEEKGLLLSARKLSLEQRAADLQAALLDIDKTALKAKQDINKAGQDETNLKNDWDAALAQELQNTESELDTIALKLSTSRSLMSEALSQSADEALRKDNAAGAGIAYVIVREKDGRATEIPAEETTQVLPGDVIKVQLNVAMR